jgi:DNA-binding NarL/FixJ family response regulator
VIDVLIVDDNPIVRAALRGYLDGTDETRVVGEAGDGSIALQLAHRLRPAVTLLDYRMPVADGLSVVSAISAYSAVLVLTSDESEELVTAMLRGGARGYLVHGMFDLPDLLRAVRAVAAGEGWLSPRAASVVAHTLRDADSAKPTRLPMGSGLTGREHDVLNLLCLGLSNAAIGERLWLTEKTVKNHLNHAFAKLGVSSRAEAIVFWSRVRRR